MRLLPIVFLAIAGCGTEVEEPEKPGIPDSPLVLKMLSLEKTKGKAPVGGVENYLLVHVRFTNPGKEPVHVGTIVYEISVNGEIVSENQTTVTFQVQPGNRELPLEVQKAMERLGHEIDTLFDKLDAARAKVRLTGTIDLTIDGKTGTYRFESEGIGD